MEQPTDKKSPFEVELKVRPYATPRIANLLLQTIFGTEGKLRYTQPEIVDRIKSQRHIEFIEIQKGNRILGTTGIIHRPTLSNDSSLNTLYVRYLSMHPAFKNKKRKLDKRKASAVKKNSLRDEIMDTLVDHFEAPFKERDQKGAFYAYVEARNLNSKELCESMGFQPHRLVHSHIFTRFNPKESKKCQILGQKEHGFVAAKLQKFYEDHSFYFEDRLFDTGYYFIKKVKGNIVGGIRANPVSWKIVDYPGFEGWLMREVLPYMPLTNRLFDPRNFRFVAFDYAWHTEGNEKVITELMSHACKLIGINTGLIWTDARSEMEKVISRSNMGILHSILGAVPVYLMVRPIEADTELRERLVSNPVFISSLDLT